MKFNTRHYGYYRVNYPGDMWATFIMILLVAPETFEPEDKANLLNDAFSLAEAGLLSYEVPLNMSTYLRNETHLVPWETVYVKLEKMAHLLKASNIEGIHRWFDEYVISLVAGHYKKPDEEDEISKQGTYSQKLWRMRILSLACRHNYANCLLDAEYLFDQWYRNDIGSGTEKSNETTWKFLDPDVRLHLLSYGLAQFNDMSSLWEKVLERYKAEKQAYKRDELLYALSFGKIRENEALIRFILDLLQNPEIISGQDKLKFLSYLCRNSEDGANVIWSLFTFDWENLVARYGKYSAQLADYTKALVENYATTPERLEEVKEFFKKHPIGKGTGNRARKQAIETVENDLKWRSKYPELILKAIKKLLPTKGRLEIIDLYMIYFAQHS